MRGVDSTNNDTSAKTTDQATAAIVRTEDAAEATQAKTTDQATAAIARTEDAAEATQAKTTDQATVSNESNFYGRIIETVCFDQVHRPSRSIEKGTIHEYNAPNRWKLFQFIDGINLPIYEELGFPCLCLVDYETESVVHLPITHNCNVAYDEDKITITYTLTDKYTI
jgi:hypothetical protein